MMRSLLLLLLCCVMLFGSGSSSPTTDRVMERIAARCDYSPAELADLRNQMNAVESGTRGLKPNWEKEAREDTRTRCNYTDAEIAQMDFGDEAASPQGSTGAQIRQPPVCGALLLLSTTPRHRCHMKAAAPAARLPVLPSIEWQDDALHASISCRNDDLVITFQAASVDRYSSSPSSSPLFPLLTQLLLLRRGRRAKRRRNP